MYTCTICMEIVEFSFSFDVQWKHVILGFYFEQNSKVCFLSTVISFLAFKIHNTKCIVDYKTR